MNKLFISILIILPFLSKAQVVNDAKLWTGISVSKQINDFNFTFSEDLRFDENMSHVDKVFSEIGADYKIIKSLYAGLNYRFSKDNDYETNNYNIRHRFDLFLAYKRKYKDFRFSIRSKLQRKSAIAKENSPTFSRNKFAIKYKLKNDFTPFISYEFYYQFNEERVINRTRISLGSKYKLNKKNAFKFFYIFENRINVKNLKHNHIYGVSYSFKL